MRKSFLSFAVVPFLSAVLFAQQPDANQQTTSVEPMDHTPVYRVKVLSRTTKAVNYRHHSGGTSLDFRGTDLMPEASGHAKVESRTGRIEINADFEPPKGTPAVRSELGDLFLSLEGAVDTAAEKVRLKKELEKMLGVPVFVEIPKQRQSPVFERS